MKGMAEVQHYYTVGKHGPPTKETAPHGYASRRPGHQWTFGYLPASLNIDAEWWPLPAPPTEQAPPPEPVARWTARNLGCGWSSLRCGPDLNHPSHEDATAAADALNTLDRDGVAWGEPRPPEALPETGRVLIALAGERLPEDVVLYCYDAQVARSAAVIGRVRCWWPLPEVTP